MTNAIEVTKREMYEALANMRGRIEINHSIKDMLCGVDEFEHTLEDHIEALRQERAALVTERDTLRNRVQVLEMANATSGEVIRSLKQEVTSLKHEASQARKNLMAARLLDLSASVSVPPYSASGAPLDTNTATILGALVDAQRIMTDYLVPDGIRAKDAMGKLIPVLDNEKLTLAMRAFEKSKCDHFTESGEGGMCRKCGEIVFGKDTTWVWTKPHCMHSFHPAFPSGELCTFCGVGK